MNDVSPAPSFLNRHFAPEDRLAEVICGLVMVLTFTATTSATFEGTTPHALLIAVLGCNIAWGIVDGVTYILGNLLVRGARARLITRLKHAQADPAAVALAGERLDAVIGDLLTPAQRQQVLQWVIEGAKSVEPEPAKLKKGDVLTGVACFLIVFGAALPVLVPFVLIDNEAAALRVANALMLLMLFVIGWRWAKFANLNRWKTGLALLGLGLVLVGITVVLGG
jgi:hypothetical protein